MRYLLPVLAFLAGLVFLPGCEDPDDPLELVAIKMGGAGQNTHSVDDRSSMPERWPGEWAEQKFKQQQENNLRRNRTRVALELDVWNDVPTPDEPEWKALRRDHDAGLRVFVDARQSCWYELRFERGGKYYYTSGKSAKSCVRAATEWLERKAP